MKKKSVISNLVLDSISTEEPLPSCESAKEFKPIKPDHSIEKVENQVKFYINYIFLICDYLI